MTSVGETLRRARLKRNLELSRIADELKISTTMLRAIEEERFEKLPSGVFARSFVRQYARLLEVDEREILDELAKVLEPPPVPEPAHPPASAVPLPRMQGWQAVGDISARWSSSVWSLVMVVLVMLACAGAYAWWQRARRPVAVRQQPPMAARTAPVEPSPAPAATAIPAPAVEAPAPAEHAEPLPEPAPAETARPQETGATEANVSAPVRVEIVAVEPAWISVRADGQDSFTGVLETSQSRTVAANQSVLLKLGNAGGVEVRWNGKSIGAVGAKGAVRTIQFTSGGFHIVPPEEPKPAPLTESPNPF